MVSVELSRTKSSPEEPLQVRIVPPRSRSRLLIVKVVPAALLIFIKPSDKISVASTPVPDKMPP